MPVRLKRVYEEKTDEDGVRILVDRLWPRGLSKDEAGIDLWLKDVAPSQISGAGSATIQEMGGIPASLPGRTRAEGICRRDAAREGEG
jgi:hypothetical protein